jgi:hypothetical protein
VVSAVCVLSVNSAHRRKARHGVQQLPDDIHVYLKPAAAAISRY